TQISEDSKDITDIIISSEKEEVSPESEEKVTELNNSDDNDKKEEENAESETLSTPPAETIEPSEIDVKNPTEVILSTDENNSKLEEQSVPEQEEVETTINSQDSAEVLTPKEEI